MTKDSQKELFKRAAEIASVVPESMQDAAFRRALDMLQEDEGSGKSRSTRTPSRSARQAGDASSKAEALDSAEVLIEGINRTEHPEVGEASRVLERSLHILKIAKDDFGIDGLSANELARVLTEKFRIRTTRQRVNQVLDEASSLVDRSSGSGRRGARYRIMASGEKHLAEPSDEPGDKEIATTHRAKTTPVRRRSSTSRGGTKGGKAKTPGRRRSRRVGPRAAVEDLMKDGYLDEPRTIGAVRDRLENKKGRTFKVTDLSPAMTRLLRDGSLDREKNEAGQYEYQRK